AVPLRMPAIFLNRKLRVESFNRVEIKTVVETRIQKSRVMTEVVGVVHRRDARARAAKNFEQQTICVLVLAREFVEQRGVIIATRLARLRETRMIFQSASDVNHHALAAKLSFRHRLPVPAETLVPAAFGPRIREPFRLPLVSEQFILVVGVAEVLNLETLVFLQRSQHQTNLILEIV